MGAAGGGTAIVVNDNPPSGKSVAAQLWSECWNFDFFQAVRLLGRMDLTRMPVGRRGPPANEVVRFRALQALHFPASAVHDLTPGAADRPPTMTVTFMGLTGPSGALPRHYTELLLNLVRDAKGQERHALAAWFDLFNHRLISQFYRAWEKYRFFLAQERADDPRGEPEPFTGALLSLIGLGLPSLRQRLRVVTAQVAAPPETHGHDADEPRVVARIDDLALLHYGGFLAHRPRCAISLQNMLADYFGLPVRVRQFEGQWLALDAASQSQLGVGSSGDLGVNVVAGDRVWDVAGKFRLQLGPLRWEQFEMLLPDRSPTPARKAFFLLSHLVRLYVGAELDFDVQLVLRASDVPACRMAADAVPGPYLGWNTWVRNEPLNRDADDAVFAGQALVRL
jgi:type VI secretion system protein ImpH